MASSATVDTLVPVLSGPTPSSEDMLRAIASVCNENVEQKKDLSSASSLHSRSRLCNVSLDASHRGCFSDLNLLNRLSGLAAAPKPNGATK
jgi:hypothetical protein